ncbi:purine-nucleoside phosphorylase [Pseudidiomarina insulisalsae]|uniref:Purine nucleoside phosphorylase DeoD-type n=1 Tax=Pseudidiomarina insulisalsae TaxID=575789 RepID=A0A432Y8L5_9GAMM|nr:purine-nucleoside phosphorylase [Pseudidiomarina insulisalsae]RUO57320.1 purine-nucleoside phosphorylase [Pseudidiomarina insulisalsae]
MATPHISASEGQFAATCLLPGDPLRAKYIAETFLTDVECVTAVRNMLGYTGYFQGQRISVMGSGMGMPSCAIYATELVRYYGVQRLVRVGSCGAVQKELKLNDVLVANSASTDSNMNKVRFGGFDFAACASPRLVQSVLNFADQRRKALAVGQVFSTDSFYDSPHDQVERLQRMGVLAVEMEAAALYGIAASYQVQALTMLTVSDHLLTGEQLPSEARQNGFTEMVEFTLSALTGKSS